MTGLSEGPEKRQFALSVVDEELIKSRLKRETARDVLACMFLEDSLIGKRAQITTRYKTTMQIRPDLPLENEDSLPLKLEM